MLILALLLLLLALAAMALLAVANKLPVSIRRGLAACCTLAFLVWALRPSAEYLFRSRTAILIDQLLGRGCQYQETYDGGHTLNPLTELGIRHPDFACPMWAAAHLAAMQGLSSEEREAVLKAIDAALALKPDEFDTGDGVIHYGRELRQARDKVRSAPGSTALVE